MIQRCVWLDGDCKSAAVTASEEADGLRLQHDAFDAGVWWSSAGSVEDICHCVLLASISMWMTEMPEDASMSAPIGTQQADDGLSSVKVIITVL